MRTGCHGVRLGYGRECDLPIVTRAAWNPKMSGRSNFVAVEVSPFNTFQQASTTH
jgi:hypothetical protein